MKIAIILDCYWESRGGIEFVVTQLANHWSQAGHELSLISYEPEKKLHTDYLLDARVRRINLGMSHDEGKAPSVEPKSSLVAITKKSRSGIVYLTKQIAPPFFFRFLKELRNKIKKNIPLATELISIDNRLNTWKNFFTKNNFDIINFHNFHSFPMEVFTSIKNCFPRFIVTFHEPHIYPRHYSLWGFLDKNLYNETAYFNHLGAMTVLLRESLPLFPNYLQNKIHVIPNMTLKYNRVLPKANSREPIILTVSRFWEGKNILLLLKSFYSVKEELSGWKLYVIGSLSVNDKYYKQCQKFVQENNLSESIYLFCDVDNNFLEEVYLKSAIYVQPSIHEGWCLAISDAMKYGLPCIGFADIPGVNFLIEHKQTGFLVDDYERQSGLANALVVMANMSLEERDRYGSRGHKKVEQYSAENILPLWDKVLHEVYQGIGQKSRKS